MGIKRDVIGSWVVLSKTLPWSKIFLNGWTGLLKSVLLRRLAIQTNSKAWYVPARYMVQEVNELS